MKRERIKWFFLFSAMLFRTLFIWADEVVVTSSYQKPDNMSATVKEIKELVTKVGGTFSGNEYEGSFSAFGATSGSYSVSGNTITFTIKIANDTNTAIQQKLLFSFSIDAPKNMLQALDAVRVGLEKDGGYFYGNEYGGYFRGKGIRGNYVVGENVVFYIFEKPFVIPNSFIEKEIRNYFVGK